MPSLSFQILALWFWLLLLPAVSSAGSIIGGDILYTVQRGDTLMLIGARTGVNWWKIAKDNSLDTKKSLKPGRQLKINTRRIVPVTIDSGIIINIPDRTLYYFRDSRLAKSFSVGLGLLRSKTASSWKTPTGRFTVVEKKKNPTWFVPPSIQEEMALEGKEVVTSVPPGPNNPLGRYALRTSLPGILIHETINPSSVNQYRSHGCIRVLPHDMPQFFEEVELNTPGELLYKPVKAAISDKDRVFLEAHRDVYSRIKDMKEEARAQLEKINAAHKADWIKVEKVLNERSGIAEDVTL